LAASGLGPLVEAAKGFAGFGGRVLPVGCAGAAGLASASAAVFGAGVDTVGVVAAGVAVAAGLAAGVDCGAGVAGGLAGVPGAAAGVDAGPLWTFLTSSHTSTTGFWGVSVAAVSTTPSFVSAVLSLFSALLMRRADFFDSMSCACSRADWTLASVSPLILALSASSRFLMFAVMMLLAV